MFKKRFKPLGLEENIGITPLTLMTDEEKKHLYESFTDENYSLNQPWNNL
jgi:hypothetical protein